MSNLTKLNIGYLLLELNFPLQHQVLCVPLMMMKLSRFSSRQSANRYWSLYLKSLWKGLLCHVKDGNVMIFVFTMFHGQSNVERGFNINNDIVVENLKKELLIAQLLMYDHMHVKDVGAYEIALTDKLRRSCLASSSKRKQILAENKKEKALSEKEKTKERLTEEIGKVLQQVEVMKATISDLDREDAECCDKAEEAGADVQTIVGKGNALRRAATEKRKLVDEFQIAAKNMKE